MAESWVIETAGLRKDYGAIPALRGLDLQVPQGSMYGFLGRNGAGKTTAIKTLLGMTHPTAGRASVFGMNAADPDASVDIRRHTGFVSEDKDLIEGMTVEGIVRFTASFYPGWRGDLEQRYLRRFELPAFQKVKALSRGTRTKLALLLALCRGAKLLILDEPTSGLDPTATEDLLQALVAHVAKEETTVFFSSHQIVEVDQIADHVAIIDAGRAVVAGALEELSEKYSRIQLVFDGEPPEKAFQELGVVRVRRSGRTLSVLSSAGSERVIEQARALNPIAVDIVPVTLKEIFLETVAKED